MLENLSKSDTEVIIRSLATVAKGLQIGNDSALIRETAKKSDFTKESVQLVIGLCAIFWGRAELEDLEFRFSNELTLRFSNGEPTQRRDLNSYCSYKAVAQHVSTLDPELLIHFAKTLSSEYAEVLNAMPIIGEIELRGPEIKIKSHA